MGEKQKRLHEEMIYRPTLIIGVGGVGTNIARHTVRWIHELTGQNDMLPPFIKVLCFDTDSQVSGDEYFPTLKENVQFYNLSGFSASRLLNVARRKEDDGELDYLKPFIKAEIMPGQIHRGAHGIPLIGRLCYAYHRNKRAVPPLTQAVMDLLDITLAYNCKKKGYPLYSGNITPTIHLISSVCGGTGAGILLDVALDVRQIVLQYSNNDPDMVAHLVLPPVFQSKYNPLSKMHERNAYYLLRQIDYLMGGRRPGRVSMKSSNGQSELKDNETLFDTVYIVNARVKNKTNTEKHIGRMVASFCLEPLGREINSMWDNIRIGKLDSGNVRTYCGYGFKSYKTPYNNIERVFEMKFQEFLKKITKFTFDADADAVLKAKSFFDDYIEKMVTSINANFVKRNIHKGNLLAKCIDNLKLNERDFKKQFWQKILHWARNNNIDAFVNIFEYAAERKSLIASSMKEKSEIISMGEAKVNSVSELGDAIKPVTDALNDYVKLFVQNRIVALLEIQRPVVVGEILKKVIEEYTDQGVRQSGYSESLVNHDLFKVMPELLDTLPDLGASYWKAEYLSLVKMLVESSENDLNPEILIRKWMGDAKKGFLATVDDDELEKYKQEFTESFSANEYKIHQQMVSPEPEPFMLYDIMGGSSVDTLIFLQSSLKNDDDEEKGYQPCLSSENSDWILCKMHMGLELVHLKDFEERYSKRFLESYSQQKALWGMPLFHIDYDEVEHVDHDKHVAENIFKIPKDYNSDG